MHLSQAFAQAIGLLLPGVRFIRGGTTAVEQLTHEGLSGLLHELRHCRERQGEAALQKRIHLFFRRSQDFRPHGHVDHTIVVIIQGLKEELRRDGAVKVDEREVGHTRQKE